MISPSGGLLLAFFHQEDEPTDYFLDIAIPPGLELKGNTVSLRNVEKQNITVLKKERKLTLELRSVSSSLPIVMELQ